MKHKEENFTPENPQDDFLLDPMESMDDLEMEIALVHSGEIVKGKVVSVDSSGILVDIGYKSEGIVPYQEVQQDEFKPGDDIDVYILSMETPTGLVSLSKSIADQRRGWLELEDAFRDHKSITGKFVSQNKAGLIINHRGIEGFLPLSQSGISSNSNPFDVNENITVHVIDFDMKRKKVIFSRKQALEEEKLQKKKELFDSLNPGDKIQGKVKSLTSYGAFIDLGGIDGLLHISDMSWKQIRSPEEILKPGQDIETLVLKVDSSAGRISLGLKQLESNPWDAVESKYPVGTIITGKITALIEYGAFVELEPGIEGMVHVSEISWTRRVEHPSEVLTVGQEIQVKILSIDKSNQRIALGIKQTQEDPWEEVAKKYKVSTVVKGKVTRLTHYGAFVELEAGVEGLVHKSDFSWTKVINQPSEFLKEGQEIEARVIKLTTSQRKIGLGIKQLTSDPWLSFLKIHKEGSAVSGKVTKIVDSGIFVELDGGIEGFCRISQLDSKRVAKIEDFCKIGDAFEFKLLRIQKASKRLVLSRRVLLEDQEKADLKQYMSNVSEAKTNLGELLHEVNLQTIASEREEQ